MGTATGLSKESYWSTLERHGSPQVGIATETNACAKGQEGQNRKVYDIRGCYENVLSFIYMGEFVERLISKNQLVLNDCLLLCRRAGVMIWGNDLE